MFSLAKSIFSSRSLSTTFVTLTLLASRPAVAFDNTRYDNLAVYWGQNSYGAVNTADTANWQQRLSYYCGDDSVMDAIPVAFLNVFSGTGGEPSINLANTCNPTDNATFPGTDLPDCSALAPDIETCQSKGKIVTISLGGATGSVGFDSDSDAEDFADTVWNLFLGGSSDIRPFGDAVLDGVDLDIESGGSTSYAAFVNRIRSNAAGASKTYFVTAAPQCVYPDSALGAVLNAADFDAVYVQFYNNQCGLNNFNTTSDWDFGLWDYWARNVSPNPDVKVYIGAPASSTAAGSGYLSASELGAIATQMRDSFPSFGGVMLWDASQAYANDRYDVSVKDALTAAGGTGFTYPACSAAAYVAGQAYSGGEQVSYGGYVWEAKWYADDTPTSDSNSDWSAISACSSGGSSSPSSGTTSSAPSTQTSISSTASLSSTATSTSASASASASSSSTTTSSTTTTGNCAGISAWTSGIAYTAGEQVTYNDNLWTANYWSFNDAPNTVNGDWTENGACTTTQAAIQTSVSSATSGFVSSALTPSPPTDGTIDPIERVRSRFFLL